MPCVQRRGRPPRVSSRPAASGNPSQEIAKRLQENEEKVKELHNTVRDLHNKLRATVQRSDNMKRDMDKECARLKADIDLWVRAEHPCARASLSGVAC